MPAVWKSAVVPVDQGLEFFYDEFGVALPLGSDLLAVNIVIGGPGAVLLQALTRAVVDPGNDDSRSLSFLCELFGCLIPVPFAAVSGRIFKKVLTVVQIEHGVSPVALFIIGWKVSPHSSL